MKAHVHQLLSILTWFLNEAVVLLVSVESESLLIHSTVLD